MRKKPEVIVRNPKQIVETSEYIVETEGKAKAGFKDIMDALEHAVNIVLSGEHKTATVKATINIEAVE